MGKRSLQFRALWRVLIFKYHIPVRVVQSFNIFVLHLIDHLQGKMVQRFTSWDLRLVVSFAVVSRFSSSSSEYLGQLGIPPDSDSSCHTRSLSSLRRATAVNVSNHQVVSIAVGFEHALALISDGSLLSTGANPDGQLGIGSDDPCHTFTLVRIALSVPEQGIGKIRAGADTSALITNDGTLWTWGNSVGSVAFGLLMYTK